MPFARSGCYPHLTSHHLPLVLLAAVVVLPTATANTLVTVKFNKYINTDNTKDQDDIFCNTDESPCNIQFDVKLLAPVNFQ